MNFNEGQDITVLIPTSPSLVHPDTTIIDTCIASLRRYLPKSKIIIMFDGIRPEMEHHRENYTKYIETMRAKYSESETMRLMVHSTHKHQSGMVIEALKEVTTSQLFFAEHDWEFVGEIPFEQMYKIIDEGTADLIRILYPTILPPYYMHMMVDQEPQLVNGLPLVKTFQWSMNPNLASTNFYKEFLNEYFNPDSKTFLENQLSGAVVTEYQTNGWGKFKTYIYVPEGNTQRCVHLDGRKGELQHFD